MESIIKKLGKTSVTVEKDYHSSEKEYNKLTIVEEEGTFKTYLSRKPVPIGIELTNREYWIPFSGVLESITFDYLKFKKDYASGKAIENNAIITRHILDRNIERIKIALKAISEEEIDDNAIIERTIKDRNVTSNKIAKENILTEHFAKKSVITAILADYVITAIKLADNSVTTRTIVNENITQEKLSTDIQSLISNLSKTFTFAGIAIPTTNPGKPDGPVFYIANGKGTYSNFGDIVVIEDEIVILYYDINWHKITTGIASQKKLIELNEKVDSLALGKFYGYFPNSSSLPVDITISGYAYVGLDSPYKIWNFNGKSWSDSGTSIDMNDADEEDITRNADGKLQFKDKEYGDGMGYVILRKNKSFAEQVIKENTIYEIKYEFDLNGEEIIIPNNCVLKFNGGSISNGTLNGSETLIDNVDSLTSVFNSIILKGTFSNKQNSFKWWGAIANDSTKALHNGTLFTYLLNNHPTIEIDDSYYLNFPTVTISNKITLYGNGSIILSRGNIIPAEGFSIIVDNISFTIFRGNFGFIDAGNLSILIDKISFRNCNIKGENGGARFIYIDFADLDLSHTIGIRTFEFVNNNVNNGFVTCRIDDCQFVDSVNVKGNSFIDFTEAPICFAATNEKTYSNERCNLSAPIQICNNSFVCKDVCTEAYYHCSCVIETDTVYFNGNYIEGIASIDGNDAHSGTAYDAYLSVKTLYYTNNTIKNVMGWRNDGNEKGPDVSPLTEIFKSKGADISEKTIRIIKNNYFEIEKSWLDYNEVPDNCNSINLFCFTSAIDTVLFENNVINIPGTILAASNLIGTGKPVRHYYVNNNTIICKEMKGALCSVNNRNADVDDISIECCRNRIKVSTRYIILVKITSSKDDTPVNSIICKNNECNAFALIEASDKSIVKNLIFEHTFPNGCINDIATIVVPSGDYKKYKLIFDEVWNSSWTWYNISKMINNWSFAKKPTNSITCSNIINNSTNTHLNCFIKYIKNGVVITHGISVDYVEGEYSYTVDGVTKSVGTSWNDYIRLLSTDGLDFVINGNRNFYLTSNDKSWDNGTYYDLNFSVS